LNENTPDKLNSCANGSKNSAKETTKDIPADPAQFGGKPY
jgi:hypothetical protein